MILKSLCSENDISFLNINIYNIFFWYFIKCSYYRPWIYTFKIYIKGSECH
jgi:hypothetical protein